MDRITVETRGLTRKFGDFVAVDHVTLSVLKDIFLKGVGLSVIGPEILFLTIFAVVVALAATRKVKGKIA